MENEAQLPLKIEYWHPPAKEAEGQAVEVVATEPANNEVAQAAKMAAKQRRLDIAVSMGAVTL